MKITFSRLPAILAVLAVFTLACGLSSTAPTLTLPPPTPLVVTVVGAHTGAPLQQTTAAASPTLAPSPTMQPTQTPVPATVEPTSLPPSPTQEPTAAAPEHSTSMPVGFVADTHDGIGLTFFNLDGSLITELAALGLSENDSQRVHVGGPWQGDLSTLPVIYYSSQGPANDPGTDWLGIVEGSSNPVWVKAPQFYAMAGAPAQPVVAYSTMNFEESQPRSGLYAANLQSLPGAPALFLIADPDGYMVRPLAVDAEGGKLMGVWYTMAAWGIGGDIVFEPRKGLKYLDMSTGKVNEILNRDMSAWDVSPDRNWVAYSTIQGPLSLLNRQNGETFTFPLLPDNNRGAGDARISPDGQYVAWMEGSGWTMAENPDFHASIRIATTAGVPMANIPQAAFDAIASSEQVSWVEPAGWLDGQTLVVQVRYQDWNHAALIRIHFDGSNPVYLATGTFVTFLYP